MSVKYRHCAAVLAIALVATGLVPASEAAAQSPAVVIEGNRRIEVGTIQSYLRLRPGGEPDAAQIDESLKGLYATGLVQERRISRAGGRIIVPVVEAPVINRVAFEGNKQVKDDALLAEIQSKPRGSLLRPRLQADTARIVEVYRRAGRYGVRVEPKVID